MKRFAHSQRGIVLILSLIMLVVLTLLAVSAIRLSTVNLRTVANAQARSEAMSAAQRTINCVLSSNFADNASTIAAVKTGPCAHDNPPTRPLLSEGGKDYRVTIDPSSPCLMRSLPVPNAAIPVSLTAEPCAAGSSHYPMCTCRAGSGVNSQCSETIWQIRATATAGWFGATVDVTQGTGIRMDNGRVAAYISDPSIPQCPGT